jgi:hypothetical protein
MYKFGTFPETLCDEVALEWAEYIGSLEGDRSTEFGFDGWMDFQWRFIIEPAWSISFEVSVETSGSVGCESTIMRGCVDNLACPDQSVLG